MKLTIGRHMQEFRRVLERSGTELEPRLLNKLLDDIDPQMHGFVHWRAFVEGRMPELVARPASEQTGEAVGGERGKASSVWRLSEPAAGPYFLNGLNSYRLRQVLVAKWNDLLSQCITKQKEEMKKAREAAIKNQKEFKPTRCVSVCLDTFRADLMVLPIMTSIAPTLVLARTRTLACRTRKSDKND